MEENRNIEDFLKKRLESQQFVFYEDDWKKMENKLNDAGFPIQGKSFRPFSLKSIIIVSGALSIAFVLGWLSHGAFTKNDKYGTGDGKVSAVETKIETVRVGNSNENKAKIAGTLTEGNDEKANVPRLSAMHHENNPFTKQKDAPGNNIEAEKGHRENIIENSVPVKNIKNSAKEKRGTREVYHAETNDQGLAKKQDNNHQNIQEEPGPFIDNQETPRIEEGTQLFADVDNIQPVDPIMNNSLIGFSQRYPLIFTNSTSTVATYPTRKRPPVFLNRFYVGFTLAPDLNSVGILNEKMVTARVGGSVYFNINKRFSISSGVFYSNKKYSTSAEYYEPGGGYWAQRTNGILPDNIYGTCRVIDVPVMISYKYYQGKFFTLLISGGASNYFLQDEYYDFEFKQENPGAANGWQTVENSMAPFGIANFSTGIEAGFNNNILFLFEPILQVPVRKIGWGNVLLYSFGLQATIKYNL